MTNDKFAELSDNLIDKAKFKTNKEQYYKVGLVKSINYNYNTGEAEVTILGE